MRAKRSLFVPKPLDQKLLEGFVLVIYGIAFMGTAIFALYGLIRIIQDPSTFLAQIPWLLPFGGTAVYALAAIRHGIRYPRPSWVFLERDDMARYLPASRKRWSRADDTSSN